MKRQPTHPGAILKEVLPALNAEYGVSVTRFANDLHISRTQLYAILDEKKSVTPNIAARLGKVLGNGAASHDSDDHRQDAEDEEGSETHNIRSPPY